ncbi:MAG: helicase-associated domain-containing protein [Chloroflexota bacterium]
MTSKQRTLLDSYHTNTLREIAEANGISIKDKRGKNFPKDALHDIMIRDFFIEARVSNSYRQLQDREKAALNRILLSEGETPARSLKRNLMRANVVTAAPEKKTNRHQHYYSGSASTYGRGGYQGSPSRKDSTIFEDVISRLTYFGLVFTRNAPVAYGTNYKMRYQPGGYIFVPDEIRQFLPKPEPVVVEALSWTPTQVDHSDPTLLLRDLYLYWDFTRKTPLELIQSGFVGKRFLKAVNTVLLQPDPTLTKAKREDETPRLYQLRTLLQSLDLLQLNTSTRQLTAQLVNNGHIPDFWTQPLPQQIASTVDAWVSRTGWSNNHIKGLAKYLPTYGQAYQVVIDLLKRSATDDWLDVETILLDLQETNIDFLTPLHSRIDNAYGGWFSEYTGHDYVSGYASELVQIIEDAEARFVHQCLKEDLFELGLIDIGYKDEKQQHYAVRLSALGRLALGLASASDQPLEQVDTGKVIVQPTFEILALGPVGLNVLAYLDLVATRQQVDRGAFAYQLTRESIYKAQQADIAVSEISQWLSEQSGQSLPQNVLRSLKEWGAHHERIVFRLGVTLLQAPTGDAIDNLRATPDIGQHLARSLTENVAIIKDEQAEALVTALYQQKVLPALDDLKPEATDQSVHIQEDGTITPIHAVPSLRLQGRLSRVGEQKTDGQWQLNENLIKQAGGNKHNVDNLLAELTKLQRGDLSANLISTVKAWGGYYGEVAAETLTLIEFRDHEILSELLQHPDLQNYLTRFPTEDRALAVVTKKSLTRVKKVLNGLGVSVKGQLTS